MDMMENLLKEFEQRIIAAYGEPMQNMVVEKSTRGYAVQFNVGDGAIYIFATNDGALFASVVEGHDINKSHELYSTPFIGDVARAQGVLKFIEDAINDSNYFAYTNNVRGIAEEMKKRMPF